MVDAVQFPNGETYEHRNMWNDDINAGRCVLLKGEKAETALHEYRRAELLKDIKPGMTLTVVCTNDRGTSRHYRVFVPLKMKGGKPYIKELTGPISKLCGHRTSKGGDIVTGGCSPRFRIVYDLGCALWPNGTRKPHGVRNGEPDLSGGYALKAN